MHSCLSFLFFDINLLVIRYSFFGLCPLLFVCSARTMLLSFLLVLLSVMHFIWREVRLLSGCGAMSEGATSEASIATFVCITTWYLHRTMLLIAGRSVKVDLQHKRV